jgi:hypothetical protein
MINFSRTTVSFLGLLFLSGCVPVPWFTGFNWSDSMRFISSDLAAYCNENYFTTQAGREIGRALISGTFPAIEFHVDTNPDGSQKKAVSPADGQLPRAGMTATIYYSDPPVGCTPGYWNDTCLAFCPTSGICQRTRWIQGFDFPQSYLEAKWVTFGVSSFHSWRWTVTLDLGNGESFNIRKKALYDGGPTTMSVDRHDCHITSSWYWECLTTNQEKCLLF